MNLLKWNKKLLTKFIELNGLHGTPIFHIDQPLSPEFSHDLFEGNMKIRIQPNTAIEGDAKKLVTEFSICK